jgi:hypothetical protein
MTWGVPNVGETDRWFRLLVGVGLMFLFALEPPWAYLGFLALVPLLTALFRRCVLWRALRISTVKPAPRSGA